MRLMWTACVGLAVLAAAGCGGGSPTAARQGTAARAGGAGDDVAAERAKLPAGERAAVDAQEWCAVSTDERLGSMGPPLKLELKGQPVYLCCKGCKKTAERDPDKTLAAVADLKAKKAAANPR